MTPGELTGTAGVTVLLIAFALNITGKLSGGSRTYLMMNAVGAALAGFSSYLIRFWPFVVLEGVWMIASLTGYFNSYKKK